MLFNVSVWSSYDEYEYDPDSWLTGPDDDFIPSEYNSTSMCVDGGDNLTYQQCLDIVDSCVTIPGHITFDIVPNVRPVWNWG